MAVCGAGAGDSLGLLGFCIIARVSKRAWFLAWLALFGIGVSGLSAALSFGPGARLDLADRTGASRIVDGFAGSGRLFCGCPQRASAALAVLALGVDLSLLNQISTSPDRANAVHVGARALHPVSWGWPQPGRAGYGLFAALVYLLQSGLEQAAKKPKMAGMNHSISTPDTSPHSQAGSHGHIFFCLNQRDNGETCCAQFDATAAFECCKSQALRPLVWPGRARCGSIRQVVWTAARPGGGGLSRGGLVQLC